MSAKSTRHHHNQQTESRLLDHDQVEQRALQISRDEGRDAISEDDRDRAREELLAPNETEVQPETTPDMNEKVTAWDEAPASSGTQAPTVRPEDDHSIGKELVENGLRGPHRTRQGEEPLISDQE